METVIKREFIVNAAVDTAFNHLAQVEKWPSWAKYIRRVDLEPTGPITAVTGAHFTSPTASKRRSR